MENSAEYRHLRIQEELGRRLIVNQSAKTWTAWITTNPVSLVQNVFGGGRRQDIELAIAQLELELSRLKAQQEALEDSYRKSLNLLLNELGRLERELTRVRAAHLTQSTRVAIARVGYRQGEGSHASMISLEDKLSSLQEASLDMREQIIQIQQEIRSLCGIGSNYGG